MKEVSRKRAAVDEILMVGMRINLLILTERGSNPGDEISVLKNDRSSSDSRVPDTAKK